jgi:hypothetical protein
MLEYVGNCKDLIDWNSIIKQIEIQEGKCACKYLPVSDVAELKQMQKNLGNYPESSIEWINL